MAWIVRMHISVGYWMKMTCKFPWLVFALRKLRHSTFSELPEQVQENTATNKCEPVVRIQCVLPYAGSQVVVKYEQSTADIRNE